MTRRSSVAPGLVSGEATPRPAPPLVPLLVVLGLVVAACLSSPSDDCPGGVAGRPGCPRGETASGGAGAGGAGGAGAAGGGAGGGAGRWQGEGCPPPDLVPELSWSPRGLFPSGMGGDLLAAGDGLFFLGDQRGGFFRWSGSSWDSLPNAEEPLASVTLAHDGLSLFSVGGWHPLFAYREETGWQKWAMLPEGRAGATALVHEGRLMLFGGVSDSHPQGSDDVLVYNLSGGPGGVWGKLPPMPEPRAFARGVRVGSFYYLLGGATRVGPPAVMAISTLVYDLVQQTWAAVSPIPEPRHSHATALLCDRVVVAGGQTAYGVPLSSVLIFEPQSRVWRSAKPLPDPVVSFGLQAFEGKLHLVDTISIHQGHRIGTVEGWSW